MFSVAGPGDLRGNVANFEKIQFLHGETDGRSASLL